VGALSDLTPAVRPCWCSRTSRRALYNHMAGRFLRMSPFPKELRSAFVGKAPPPVQPCPVGTKPHAASLSGVRSASFWRVTALAALAG
jgi:hypothetical protein